MIFLPFSTDAPIYHYPIATGGIIVANTVIFLATTFQASLGNIEYDQLNWLILMFDQINVLQWVTNNFMHAGFMHLLSNMFFLWSFGLVVEGKIGSLKFFGLYMAMGAAYGALVQIPMFVISGEGGALGATGVIFAVMMIALLWAPENEIECVYWFFYLFGIVDIRIVKLAGTFLLIQLLFLWISGFSMSSEMLHVAGAAIGAPVGLWMLRNDHVDCEDWDLISRNEWLQGHDLLFTEKQRRRLKAKQETLDDPVAAALKTSSTVPVSSAAKLAASSGALPAKRTSKKTAQPHGSSKASRRKPSTPDSKASQPNPKSASHPDFNRITMLLRQSIQTGSGMLAQQHFNKLEQMQISDGLSDKLLFAYVKLLALNEQWQPALRPLQIVIDRGGPSVGDALLRKAHIELNALQDAERATMTLRQIRFDSESLTEAQRKVLSLRDEMLTRCVPPNSQT